MEIELPDGTILEAPDDADPSVVAKNYLARQQSQDPFAGDPLLSREAMAKKERGEPLFTPTPTRGVTRRVTDWLSDVGAAASRANTANRGFTSPVGTAEALGTVASGSFATPIGSIAGMGTEVARGLGLTDAKGEDIAERVANALTYQPRSEAGQSKLGLLGTLAQPLSESGADVALTPLALSPEMLAAQRHLRDARGFKSAVKQAERARLARPIPTAEQINEAAQKAYAQASTSGAAASADDFASARSRWLTRVEKEGFDPDLHPRVKVIVNKLARTEGPQKFDDLERVRRLTMRNALASPEAEERRLARILIDDMDDFQESSLGTAGEAGKQARALWSAKRKGEEIEELLRRAQLSASTSHQNVENAIRTEFRNLAKNAKAMRRFTAEERGLIEQAAKGGLLRNTLRYFGKFAPTGPVSAIPSAIAAAHSGGLGGAAVAAGGAAARTAAGGLAERDVQQILNTIRRSAPLNIPARAQPAVNAVSGEFMGRPPLALPAPNIIASARSAPGTAYARQQMGLTPDVERAGALHPGMARESTSAALPYRPAASGLLADRRPMVVDAQGRVARIREELQQYLRDTGQERMRTVRQPRAEPMPRGLLSSTAAVTRSAQEIRQDMKRLDARLQRLPENEPLESPKMKALEAEWAQLRAELDAVEPRA